MTDTASDRALVRQEWRNGWPVAVASFIGFAYLGLISYSLSVFIEPLTSEFGWSRTFISSGFSASTMLSAIMAPFFGLALDRWGVRRLAIPGVALTALAIAGFGAITGAIWQWYALWLAYSVFSMATKQTTWVTAVSSAFSRGRGLALGIAMCGSALMQSTVAPLTVVLIDRFGWRLAYVALGLGWGAVTLLVCWLFLRDAKPRRDAGGGHAAAAPPAEGMTLREAMRSRALWSIAISTLLIMGLTIGFSIHQVPILMGAGVSRSNAALLVSTVGLAGIAGKVLTGLMLDRFHANWVGGLTLAVTAVSFAVLVEEGLTSGIIFFAMLVNGYTQGAKVQISSYLTARYAGMRAFGAVFGIMSAMMTLGSSIGPLLAGYAYDTTGSYSPFLVGGAIGCVIAGGLLLILPAYPDWRRDEPVVAPPVA